MKALISGYKELIDQNPIKYLNDYHNLYEQLEDSPAYYRGEVIPFLYQPLFFTKADIDSFKKITKTLARICDKIINAYLTKEEFREKFAFPKPLEELILADPGYENNFPMARFDIFYYPKGQIKFCEINTDGSSGMVKTNTLEDYFFDSKIIKELKNEYKFSNFELIDSWIDILLITYNDFKQAKVKKPNIAIIDFEGYGMTSEFKAFKERIKKRGYQVEIVDPRNLEYKNATLYHKDFRVDLIYRRAVTTDLMDMYGQCGDLIAAYKNNDVCVVGSFRSQIIHDKLIFSVLHSKLAKKILTESELEFIGDYIPYTSELKGISEQKFLELINNKDSTVLKPRDGYGAQGVLIGRDYNEQQWQKKISKIDLDNYLFQQFCQTPEKNMVDFAGDKLAINKYKYILGLFLYKQEFKGIYTRVGKDNVIASATGCYTLPNFKIEK